MSGVAQVLSLATIIAAVWRLLALRRQSPLASLHWDRVGAMRVENDQYHLVEFVNTGRGTLHLHSLLLHDAHARTDEDYRPRRMMPSGERFRLLVSAREEKTAWVQAIYRDEADVMRVLVMWKPLLPGSTHWLAWRTEADAFHPERRRVSRLWRTLIRREARQNVGPGGRTSRRVQLNTRAGLGKLATALGTPDVAYTHDLLKNAPRSLPYVPLKEELAEGPVRSEQAPRRPASGQPWSGPARQTGR